MLFNPEIDLKRGLEIAFFEWGSRGTFLTSPLGANFDPQGQSCHPGVNLLPRGEVIPWG
jgi:hypothetical protein